jgi:hypothetical protein
MGFSAEDLHIEVILFFWLRLLPRSKNIEEICRVGTRRDLDCFGGLALRGYL